MEPWMMLRNAVLRDSLKNEIVLTHICLQRKSVSRKRKGFFFRAEVVK